MAWPLGLSAWWQTHGRSRKESRARRRVVDREAGHGDHHRGGVPGMDESVQRG